MIFDSVLLNAIVAVSAFVVVRTLYSFLHWYVRDQHRIERLAKVGDPIKQVYHAALELLGEDRWGRPRPSAEDAERLSLEVRILALFPRE